MGQQQLLLIVLGVIIVGIAVVVGINVFTASSQEANVNALISDIQTLSSMANQYYRKPAAMGGGAQTYTGWAIPTSLASTANGSYVATVAAQTVTIVGTGTEQNAAGTGAITVTTIITPAGPGAPTIVQ